MQTQVLERLRELVVNSIHQVKQCMAISKEYQYRFRVIAINRAGKSQPGPSSDTVVAMHKNVSPFIKVRERTYFKS